MVKVYMGCGGGLGDCLNKFFTGEFTFAQSIKEKYPDTILHVICSSSNASSVDIFTNHPLFDSAELIPSGDAYYEAVKNCMTEGYKHWSTVFDQRELYQSQPTIQLNDSEELEVKKITDLGKYFVLHPFNSAGSGITATHFNINTDYKKIIYEVLDAGYYAIQVGGDWTHLPTGHRHAENFVYDHPRFINLVNKFNLRMTAKVVIGATKCLGTSSVWVTVAAVTGVPTFMILPEHMKDILREEAATGQGLRGTLIKTHGVLAYASTPELYPASREFIRKDLRRKVPVFTPEGFLLKSST